MSHKNETKTKNPNWLYAIFTSLHLNQLLENI